MNIHYKKSDARAAIILIDDSQNTDNKNSAHNLLMAACCLAMIIGIGIILFAGSSTETIAAKAFTALPLLACVAMHIVMHRFMGKSCHTRNPVRKPPDEQ